ncbi:MAG: zf-HC2 domain-containing protein [Candidatus Sulfotelmatobacter sp.]
MVISCEEVWREISNYLEDDMDSSLRASMEEHFRSCRHCTAVRDGTRNLVRLYGDERMFEVPLGFSHRLYRRLEENMPGNRRSFLGWMVAAAAAVLAAGSFEVARSSVFSGPELRSEHAQPPIGVPPDMMVVVSAHGKIFHKSGCPYINDKASVRTLVARDALRQGYTPCVRCMKEYLST